jgi:hypothetical protein
MKLANSRRQLAAMTLVEVIVVVGIIAVLAGMLTPLLCGKCKAKAPRIGCVNNLKQVGLAFLVFAGDNDDHFPYTAPNSSARSNETSAWLHFQIMSNELSTPRVLLCPADLVREKNQAGNFSSNLKTTNDLLRYGNEAVSYFVGVKTDVTKPRALLAGDRNIADSEKGLAYSSRSAGGLVNVDSTKAAWTTHKASKLHDNQGNALLSDGSVQQLGGSQLRNQLKLAADAYGTNVNRLLFPQ